MRINTIIVIAIATLLTLKVSRSLGQSLLALDIGIAKKSAVQARDVNQNFVVSYTIDDKKGITYNLPYLGMLDRNVEVAGIQYGYCPFEWQVPTVRLTITNKSPSLVRASAIRFIVKSSRADDRAVLVVDDRAFNSIMFHNEGWGKVTDPKLTFTIKDISAFEGDFDLFKNEQHVVPLTTFDSSYRFSIVKYVPSALRQEKLVGVSGQLQYQDSQKKEKVFNFKTRVYLEVRATAPPEDDRPFDLFLPSGKKDYSLDIPLAQDLKPGESRSFDINIWTDKTSEFALDVQCLQEAKAISAVHPLNLSIFVPRSAARFVSKN